MLNISWYLLTSALWHVACRETWLKAVLNLSPLKGKMWGGKDFRQFLVATQSNCTCTCLLKGSCAGKMEEKTNCWFMMSLFRGPEYGRKEQKFIEITSSSGSSPQTDHCGRQRGNWNVEVLNLLHCFFFSAHWGERIVRSKEGGYGNLPGNLQFNITEEAIRRYVFLLTLQSEECKLLAQISH